MKKIWERIKDAWCGALPIILLFGIPAVIGIVIWVTSNWNDLPRIANHISIVGKGSLLHGIIIFLFALIGLINAFAAFMLWFKKFTEWLGKLDRKGKPRFFLWIIIIVVTFGWYALFELINRLAN